MASVLPPLVAAPIPAPAAAPALAPDIPDDEDPAVPPVPMEPDADGVEAEAEPPGVETDPDAEGVDALADEPVPEVSMAVLGPLEDEVPELDDGEPVELEPLAPLLPAAAPIAPPTPALVSLGLVEPLLAGALEPVPRGVYGSVAVFPAALLPDGGGEP